MQHGQARRPTRCSHPSIRGAMRPRPPALDSPMLMRPRCMPPMQGRGDRRAPLRERLPPVAGVRVAAAGRRRMPAASRPAGLVSRVAAASLHACRHSLAFCASRASCLASQLLSRPASPAGLASLAPRVAAALGRHYDAQAQARPRDHLQPRQSRRQASVSRRRLCRAPCGAVGAVVKWSWKRPRRSRGVSTEPSREADTKSSSWPHAPAGTGHGLHRNIRRLLH
jgi:hypothetical protein